MAGLESWLQQATRHLAKESAAQVRAEIQEHYESAREDCIAGGATADEADRLALNSLGDPRMANRQYRQVLLTSGEARVLRKGNAEAQILCASSWTKWLRLALPIVMLWGGLVLFFLGRLAMAQAALAMGILTGILFVAPFLPIYTQSRSLVFRYVKWALIMSAIALVFGRDALRMSWLLFACVWPVAWVEWTRISIRRKLPVSAWPRQLYL